MHTCRCAYLAICVCAFASVARGEDPVEIGNRRELFVDDYLIDSILLPNIYVNPTALMPLCHLIAQALSVSVRVASSARTRRFVFVTMAHR